MNRVLTYLSGATLALGGLAASAQDSASVSSGLELEEIVVTATKRETDLQKTSISIQTYSGEELKKSGKRRIDDIMQGVVGVSVEDGAIGAAFYMRGVDRGSGYGPSGGAPQTPTVSVLIDGVYQNRGETVRGGSLDVSQVEVMRGSQGTTLGASALAGAVSLVTNKPIFDFQSSGTLEFGNYNLMNMEGVLNLPFSDNQAIRVAYSSNKRDGYISSGAGESDLMNARLKYRWKASDTLDLILTASRNKIGGNGNQFGQLLVSGHWEPYTGQGNVMPTAGSCATAGTVPAFGTNPSNQVVFRGAPGTIASARGCPATYVAVNDNVWYFDRKNPWNDGFPRNAYSVQGVRETVIDSYQGDVNWNTGIGDVTISPSVQRAEFTSMEIPDGAMAEHRVQSTRQLEARIASKPDSGKLSWVSGLYYYYTDNVGTFRNRIFPGVTYTLPPAAGATVGTSGSQCALGGNRYCFTWQDQTHAILETKSAYANATFSVLDTFRVLGGLRYQTDYKRSASTADGALRGDANGFIDNPAVRYDFNARWNNTQYRVGVEYDVLPQSMVYATFQTGYQPGSVGGMAASPNFLVTTGAPSNALKLRQFTVGMKNRFFDNRLQANIEAWDTEFRDRTASYDGVTQLVGDGSIGTATVTGGTAIPLCNNTNSGDPQGLFRVVITPTDACITPGSNITNTVADQVSKGVDLELSFLATANDRVNFNMEYLDSHYKTAPHRVGETSLPTPTASGILGVAVYAGGATNSTAQSAALAQRLVDTWNNTYGSYPNLSLAGSSEWSSTLSYEHIFHIKESTLTPRISAAYRSSYWNSSGGGGATVAQLNASLNDSSLPLVPGVQRSFTKWDALTTWQDPTGKFSVTGYVRNIGNKATIQNASLTSVSLDAPRTFGAVLSATFK
ncbi:MAG: TonB-dependent receptor [Steroidobacteraceae bacterium]